MTETRLHFAESVFKKAEEYAATSPKNEESIFPIDAAEKNTLLQRLRHHAQEETPETEYCLALVRDSLRIIRQKKWASQLFQETQANEQVWVTAQDVSKAVKRIQTLNPSPADLRHALQEMQAETWQEMSLSPLQVLRDISDELQEREIFLSPAQIETLALSVGDALGEKNSKFAKSLALQEEKRLQNQEKIRERAENSRLRELAKIEKWEKSLIPFDDLPKILHCSRREALRWIAEKRLIPVRREERKGIEVYLFDPKVISRLKKSVSEWRDEGPVQPKKPHELPIIPKGSREGNAAIAKAAALDHFAAHFKTARAMKRHITIITGPTNSGKSYAALEALTKAESGVALAPLRLLAHEFHDMLLSRGVRSSLTTGEERIIDPNARHLAATVEMCPLHNPVDVAVIDEAQMLTDPDRGAAWTAAIMGTPAREIFVLGAADCIPMVKRIAELCGDEVSEVSLKRKSPLETGHVLSLDRLRKGDALIAFSRREVLDLRAELMAMGKNVAVIYGALSPEVRCAEAARFNKGKADILIATDAIGMGLNLSIKRVVFSALQKFDGRDVRPLNSQEIKQIGGRAGRYGKHEKGLVCVLEGAGNPERIRAALLAPPEPIKDLRPQVQPDSDIIHMVAREVGTDSLYGTLSRIQRAVLQPNDPNYRLANMDQALEIAAALEGVENLDLNTRWTYAMCPIQIQDKGIVRLVEWASQHARKEHIVPPGTGRLPNPLETSREELEHAEKRHKRLVSWRWLAMRFPEIYADIEQAEKNAKNLNNWIEQVLRTQSQIKEKRRKHFSRKPSDNKKHPEKHKKNFTKASAPDDKKKSRKPFKKRPKK
ncbi:RNA helicase [Acetobacteraceae bacterium]|nr:RNA helicase [Acetobacteraceae bacterium]